MVRILENVPEGQVNFVVNVMIADGLTKIEKKKENGTWTIVGRKPESTQSENTIAASESAEAAETMPMTPLGASITAKPAASISAQAAEFMVGKESFVPFRYQDVADNATIGYGHHKGLTQNKIDAQFPRGLTEQEAWQVFLTDIEDFSKKVRSKITRDLKQHQFDALVMICFHRGNIDSEASLVNSGDDEKVAESIASLTTVRGRHHRGVAERSATTASIYLHGIYPAPKKSRDKMREQALRLTRKLYPDHLNEHGNKFGRVTKDVQRRQAAEAYFRMTGEML